MLETSFQAPSAKPWPPTCIPVVSPCQAPCAGHRDIPARPRGPCDFKAVKSRSLVQCQLQGLLGSCKGLRPLCIPVSRVSPTQALDSALSLQLDAKCKKSLAPSVFFKKVSKNSLQVHALPGPSGPGGISGSCPPPPPRLLQADLTAVLRAWGRLRCPSVLQQGTSDLRGPLRQKRRKLGRPTGFNCQLYQCSIYFKIKLN